MKFRAFFLAVAGSLSIGTPGAFAATGDVNFGGVVSTSCTIVVLQNGTLAQDASARRLRTVSADGGIPGRVRLITTGFGYTVSSSVPTVWNIKPVEDTTSTEFSLFSVGIGATTFSAFGVTPSALALGTTTMVMNMDATKPVGQSFPNGSYSVTSTVTCQ